MSIINPDVDSIIFGLLDPPELVKLLFVNRLLNKIIRRDPIIWQWRIIKKYKFTDIAYEFEFVCEHGYLPYAKYLYNKYGTAIKYYNFIFSEVCKYGEYAMVKWLLHLKNVDNINLGLHYYEENHFHMACLHGHLEIAKLLISTCEDKYGRINIHICNDLAFRHACMYGHLEVAKWLYWLSNHGYGPISDDIIQKSIHWSSHLGIIGWLQSLIKN